MTFALRPGAAAFESGEISALGSAAQWLSELVTGSLAATLCVIAIAFFGLLMFNGRVPLRDGLKVVLGCFILLGAPVVASAFLEFGTLNAGMEVPLPTTAEPAERQPLPRSTFDPYAGASLRQE